MYVEATHLLMVFNQNKKTVLPCMHNHVKILVPTHTHTHTHTQNILQKT